MANIKKPYHRTVQQAEELYYLMVKLKRAAGYTASMVISGTEGRTYLHMEEVLKPLRAELADRTVTHKQVQYGKLLVSKLKLQPVDWESMEKSEASTLLARLETELQFKEERENQWD